MQPCYTPRTSESVCMRPAECDQIKVFKAATLIDLKHD